MPTSTTAQLARIGYRRARLLLVVTGLGILAVLVAVLLFRSVDTTEVVATLLFAPIFLALLYFGMPGGLLSAAVATGVYVALRADAIDAVGWGEFSGLVLSRSIAYFLFGAVGGWASGTLEQSLDKLDLYDQIDDQTGVNNARFLLQDIELEKARAERYRTVFSVSFLELAAEPIEALPVRQRRRLLHELGRKLEDGVRSMDRVAHGFDGRLHRFATILPETAAGGAEVFQHRLTEQVLAFLTDRGVDPSIRIAGSVVTVPGNEQSLDGHLAEWQQIDSAEHGLPRPQVERRTAAGPPRAPS